MIIEEGKFYKMRNGSTVGPMIWDTDGGWCVTGCVDVWPFGMWDTSGESAFFSDWDEQDPQYDLVELYNE